MRPPPSQPAPDPSGFALTTCTASTLDQNPVFLTHGRSCLRPALTLAAAQCTHGSSQRGPVKASVLSMPNLFQRQWRPGPTPSLWDRGSAHAPPQCLRTHSSSPHWTSRWAMNTLEPLHLLVPQHTHQHGELHQILRVTAQMPPSHSHLP